MLKKSHAQRFIRFAIALLMAAALMPSLTRLLHVIEGQPSALLDVCATPDDRQRTRGGENGNSLAQSDCAACLIPMRDLLLPPGAGALLTQLRVDLGEYLQPAPESGTPGIAARRGPPPRGPPLLA